MVFQSLTAYNELENLCEQVKISTGTAANIQAVNITSPTKGQQVPIGEDLTIIGTSIANATSNCKIIIGFNIIKPYQSATGTGTGGAKDYSKWSFTLTPKYAAIKQGSDNKVTARYKCSSGIIILVSCQLIV
jgi:hypothetical protein